MIPSGSKFFVQGLGLLSAAVAAAAALFHSRLDEAALPLADDGQSTAVAFVCQYADERGLFLTSSDGEARFQLTDPPEPAVDVSPVWSPDLDPAADGYQGKIAFLRRPQANWAQGYLYIVDPDGSRLQLVASLLWGRDPVPMDQTSGGIGSESTLAWSPNGRELVFAWHGGLWAVDISTGTCRCLIDVQAAVADTAISAANQQIAFHSDGDLAIVDFEWDATGLMQLVPSTLSNLTIDGFHVMDEYPAWSPDGRYLAWRRGGRQLIVRDVQADEEQIVVEEGICSELTWSPDGRQLAFVGRLPGERPDSPSRLVRVLSWRASEDRQVITADRLQHPVTVDWNPDWSPAVRTD